MKDSSSLTVDSECSALPARLCLAFDVRQMKDGGCSHERTEYVVPEGNILDATTEQKLERQVSCRVSSTLPDKEPSCAYHIIVPAAITHFHHENNVNSH